jgi:hypothetical protein
VVSVILFGYENRNIWIDESGFAPLVLSFTLLLLATIGEDSIDLILYREVFFDW